MRHKMTPGEKRLLAAGRRRAKARELERQEMRDLARVIREERAAGMTVEKIMELAGVARQTVYNALHEDALREADSA